jgi:divalent metal cation (Fe/Co/Zn/Cd) transporter
VAVAFLVLAIPLFTASLRNLLTEQETAKSLFGIGYLAKTALVMFGLAIWKRRVPSR